jgi:hypothetical protein
MTIVCRALIAASILALAPACAAGPDARASVSAEEALVAEARAFMAAYADELRAGARAAIAARYDRSGAHLLRRGRHLFLSWGEIAALYRRSGWNAPADFEWQQLAYEPAGPDAVVVVGRFLWTESPGAAAEGYSYTALLLRREGALRIRVEDEAPETPRPQ